MLEKGGRDVVQCMYVDHRIEAPINLAGHDGDVLALLADEKISGSCAEGVPGQQGKVVDMNLQFRRWRRSPNALMGLTERTTARPSRNFGWVR